MNEQIPFTQEGLERVANSVIFIAKILSDKIDKLQIEIDELKKGKE